MANTVNLSLPHFEGPLELLHALVQKDEIDVNKLEIREILRQILTQLGIRAETIDLSAQAVGLTGHLLWLKSRALLPVDGENGAGQKDDSDFHISFLEQLVEYCHFKEAARMLAEKEERASDSYFRRTAAPDNLKKPLGIEHLSIQDLASLFQVVWERAKEHTGLIHEEEWRVGDKISLIRQNLKTSTEIGFDVLFSASLSKLELIVLFLAVLELMKLGEIRLVRLNDSGTIAIQTYG